MNDRRIDDGIDALAKQEGYAYATGFLISQLKAAVDTLPKTKQKMFMAQFEHVVGYKVKVKVRNIMSGKEVELAWNEVGGPCDPSTERYWSS